MLLEGVDYMVMNMMLLRRKPEPKVMMKMVLMKERKTIRIEFIV